MRFLAAHRDAAALKRAYADLFRSPSGVLVLRDLARFAGMTSEPAAHMAEPNAERLFVDTGMRRLVLRILAMAEIDGLDLVARTLSEDAAASRQDQALTARRGDDHVE